MQEAIGTGSIDQAEMLGRLISRVAGLEAAVADAHRSRAALHNQLVNLRGNVRHTRPYPCHGTGTTSAISHFLMIMPGKHKANICNLQPTLFISQHCLHIDCFHGR